MFDEPSMQSVLASPGTLVFPSNLPYRDNLSQAGGRVVRQASGHLIVYNRDNQRILATDPAGHPLHECEWTAGSNGTIRLKWARIHLDWGQWVGIRPAGFVNATTLDLSRKPGWQNVRPDDLRRMAAQALRVPLDEVRFFYNDDDLVIASNGLASIRHKKDAFYVLDDGSFDQAHFTACMGAMHWERIDFLPVVELFQSLLPGTGSATLELIRGLYDDQNQDRSSPVALRYRGIPTYPSEAAYQLFGAFFIPHAPDGADPFPLFMDPSRSYQVTWLPSPDPPRRYFVESERLCLTAKGTEIQKVTVADDPTGLAYLKPVPNRVAPCERTVQAYGQELILTDRDQERSVPLASQWGIVSQPQRFYPPLAHVDWRSLFEGTPPMCDPVQAFSAVLLYPEDNREIAEASSQPFVADYLQDLAEQTPELAAAIGRAAHVLIDRFDGAMASCIATDRPKAYTILFSHDAHAQKQAQLVWNRFAGLNRLEWLNRIRFKSSVDHRKEAYARRYDLIYAWVPFELFESKSGLQERAGELVQAFNTRGLAFVVGPEQFGMLLPSQRVVILKQERIDELPTFRMHRTILPDARLRPGLTLFHLAAR